MVWPFCSAVYLSDSRNPGSLRSKTKIACSFCNDYESNTVRALGVQHRTSCPISGDIQDLQNLKPKFEKEELKDDRVCVGLKPVFLKRTGFFLF